jgi:VIT1/CCC1 family predicted Fe2+/Mn2+ transporter
MTSWRTPTDGMGASRQADPFVAAASLICLGGLGALAAGAGGAPKRTEALRVVFWGAFAMAVTAGVGWIFGVAV